MHASPLFCGLLLVKQYLNRYKENFRSDDRSPRWGLFLGRGFYATNRSSLWDFSLKCDNNSARWGLFLDVVLLQADNH